MTSVPKSLIGASTTPAFAHRGTEPVARDYASEDAPLSSMFQEIQIGSSFSIHHSRDTREQVPGFGDSGPGPLALSESPPSGPAPAYEPRRDFQDNEKPGYVSRPMHEVWQAAQTRHEEAQPTHKASNSISLHTYALVLAIVLTFALNGIFVYCAMLVVEQIDNTSLLEDDTGRGLLSGLTGVIDDRTPTSALAKTAAFAALFTTLTSIPITLYAWSLKRKLRERSRSEADKGIVM